LSHGARPAAYICVARDSDAAVHAQRTSISTAASALGWAEPTIYLDVDGAAGHAGPPLAARPALARLSTAVSTGQHDALLVSVGTICGTVADIMALLGSCVRHGVAVECVTPRVPAGSGTLGTGLAARSPRPSG
jgi:hypothetical protein